MKLTPVQHCTSGKCTRPHGHTNTLCGTRQKKPCRCSWCKAGRKKIWG